MPIRAGQSSVTARTSWTRSRWMAVVGTVAMLAPALPALGESLDDAVARVIGAAKIGQARIGVSVVDLATGRTLASRDATGAYIPASNQKLLTSGAALMVLGADFSFRTEFRRDGQRLVVVGSGDPALADATLLERISPPMTVEDVVGRIVDAVPASGSFAEIVMDDRVFDTQFVHPSWPVDQLNRWYCAEVAGINFHTNTLSVYPRPGREGAGRPPEVTTEPLADWIEIATGLAKTTTGGTTSVYLTRSREGNRFELHGQVANAVKEPVPVTLHDPPVFFGELLSDRLGRRGIACGPVRRASDGETFGGDVFAVTTTHMNDILSRCNSDSYNLYAEALLKRIGHDVSGEPGSWSNGAAVARMTINQVVGADAASGAIISDGSGMSRENRVTPRLMSAWLGAIQKQPGVGAAFLASLAGPGEATLKSRFGARAPVNELQAKTGYIKGVRCLSGYLTHPETQHRVAFSILINDLKDENDGAGKKLQEAIVLLVDDWLSDQSPERADAGGR